MLESHLASFAFNNDLLRQMVAQIDPADADLDPTGHHKTPRWQVGHLLTGDLFAAAYLALELPGPSLDDLMPVYGPGSKPSDVPDGGHSMADLLDAKTAIERPLAEAVRKADAGDYQEPHGFEPLTGGALVTKQDMITHLLNSHFALHLGELAIWRRSRGIPPLF